MDREDRKSLMVDTETYNAVMRNRKTDPVNGKPEPVAHTIRRRFGLKVPAKA